MVKKRNLKIFLVLMVVGILSTAGTVMAASDISTYSDPTLLPSYGVTAILASGSRTPARDCVRFTLRTSSRTVSDSYPLYFRLRNTESNVPGSELATFKTCPRTADLYYINSTNKWQLRGQTNSNSKYSTTITFDAIP